MISKIYTVGKKVEFLFGNLHSDRIFFNFLFWMCVLSKCFWGWGVEEAPQAATRD